MTGKRQFGMGWLIGVAVTGAVIGLVLGAGLAAYGVAHFWNYSIAVSYLARGAVDIASLEKLQSGDTEGASKLLKIDLQGSLMSLEASDEYLSAQQKVNAEKLRARARRAGLVARIADRER